MSKTENKAMDIVATILANEQNNAISTYEYDGIALQQADPVLMRNTLLLAIFRPCSFIILRANKDKEIEYDEFQAQVEMLFANRNKTTQTGLIIYLGHHLHLRTARFGWQPKE